LSEKANQNDLDMANANITKKANQTDLNSTNTIVSNHTTSIANNATNIALKADKSYVDTKVAGAVSGAPKAASLVANMTDTTKNYVYTGTESGYTAGNWYYYNGSAWISGGVYQATGIADKTVTAKKTDFAVPQKGDSSSTSLNIFNPSTVTNSAYIRDDGITIYSGTSYVQYSYSDYIDVIEGETLTFSDNEPLSWIMWYDASNNFVSTTHGVTSNGVATTVTVPTGVSKMRFNFDNTRVSASSYQVLAKRSIKIDQLRIDTKNINSASITNEKLGLDVVKNINYSSKVFPVVSNSSGIAVTDIAFSITSASSLLVVTNTTYHVPSVATYTIPSQGDCLILSRDVDITTTHNASNSVALQVVNYSALLNTDVIIAWKDNTGLHTFFDSILNKTQIASINSQINTLGTVYTPTELLRKQLEDVFYKLMSGQTVNILGIGDSVMNFQNSGQLALADQKTAPIGLAGENWLRRLWKAINYNVWNDARTSITNVNGNMGFKRFDHADFTFSNGYSGTTSLGTCDWGTNRNDAESWRDNDFNGSLGTTKDRQLTSEACYNIPMVGTIKSGTTASVTIPSNAIGCRVILGKNKVSSASSSATITISDGQTKSLVPSNFVTYQNYFDFTLSGGTSKTLTLTNNSTGELWIWGIEYWTGNFVRVMNFGLAGNNSSQIVSKWDYIPKDNVDMIILETPVLNDCTAFTYTTALSNASALIDKIKTLNVPILPILVHRSKSCNGSMVYDRSTATIGTQYFVPNYIRNYKAILAKNNLAYIDMWKKSLDEIDDSLVNDASSLFPANYFVDWGHPNTLLNQAYADELEKIFLWSDID
jgi:hypothetical protein